MLAWFGGAWYFGDIYILIKVTFTCDVDGGGGNIMYVTHFERGIC